MGLNYSSLSFILALTDAKFNVKTTEINNPIILAISNLTRNLV